MSTPAGWYPDPDDPSSQRWWDGATWTDHRHTPEPAPEPDVPSADVPSAEVPSADVPSAEVGRRRRPGLLVVAGLVVIALVVVGGVVVLAGGDDDGDGAAGADLTGERLWEVDLGDLDDARPSGVLTGADGVVVVGTDDETVELHAIDVATGELLWTMADPTPPHLRTTTAVVAGSVLVADGDTRRIQAVDLRTGEPRWSVDGGLFVPFVLVGETVVVAQETAIVAVDGASGDQLWRAELGRVGNLVVHDDLVVSVAGDGDGSVVVAHEADGVERWRYETADPLRLGAPDWPEPATPVQVVTLSTLDAAIGLDAASGEELWRTPFPDIEAVLRADQDAGRALVCERTDDDGVVLTQLDLADGTEQWRLGFSPGEGGEPALFGLTAEVVVVGSARPGLGCSFGPTVVTDGAVEAYGLDDGSRRWRERVGPDGEVALPQFDLTRTRTGFARTVELAAVFHQRRDEFNRALDPDTGEVIADITGTGAPLVVGGVVVTQTFDRTAETMSYQVGDAEAVVVGESGRFLGVLDGVAYVLEMDATLTAID